MSVLERIFGRGKSALKQPAVEQPVETVESLRQKRDALGRRRDTLMEDAGKDRHYDDSTLIGSLNQQIAEVEARLKSLGSF